jgi:hypothetical protein
MVLVGNGVLVGGKYKVGIGEFFGNGNVGVGMGGVIVGDGAHGTISEKASSLRFLSSEYNASR